MNSNEGTIERNFGYAVNVNEGKILNQYYEYRLDGCTFVSGSTESKTVDAKTFESNSSKKDAGWH